MFPASLWNLLYQVLLPYWTKVAQSDTPGRRCAKTKNFLFAYHSMYSWCSGLVPVCIFYTLYCFISHALRLLPILAWCKSLIILVFMLVSLLYSILVGSCMFLSSFWVSCLQCFLLCHCTWPVTFLLVYYHVFPVSYSPFLIHTLAFLLMRTYRNSSLYSDGSMMLSTSPCPLFFLHYL